MSGTGLVYGIQAVLLFWEDLPVDKPVIKSFICYLLILMGVGNALACGMGQFLRRPYYLVIAVPIIGRAPRVRITR